MYVKDKYIEAAMKQGYIPVEKEGGGLFPCIDNQGLNQVTVKYRYPCLPKIIWTLT